jgi:hypothetical protein
MAKEIAELPPSIDVLVLKKLGVLTGPRRFIDPGLLGGELAESLRLVGAGGDRVFCDQSSVRARRFMSTGRIVPGPSAAALGSSAPAARMSGSVITSWLATTGFIVRT